MTNAVPTAVNRTLPKRLPNSAYRVREYLTEKEVDRLIEAAKRRGRNGSRDAVAILLAYRHGLRASELCSLRWSQIDLRNGRLPVNRAKGGIESVHPLHGPELRALRPLQQGSPYVFVTEAGAPLTTAWFLRMVQRTGRAAKLPFQVHPHMLRVGGCLRSNHRGKSGGVPVATAVEISCASKKISPVSRSPPLCIAALADHPLRCRRLPRYSPRPSQCEAASLPS
jgi:type 1 fimbriae regulatory protein FimB/type 1 fimbriae regulatory protein FimE